MSQLKILPQKERIKAQITIPGSKSYTNRALVIASLADNESQIRGFSESEDSKILIAALRKLGIVIKKKGDLLLVRGCAGKFSVCNCKIHLEASGTAVRFFTAIAALVPGQITLTGSVRMQNRPLGPLVCALRSLGASIDYLGREGSLPIKVSGGNLQGGSIRMKGSISSQFFTALLLIAPILDKGLKIKVVGKLASQSYLDMTLDALESFGVHAERRGYTGYTVDAEENYQAIQYRVPGDASGASYFWAIAALTPGTMRVNNIDPNSVQGDVRFPDLLQKMGCTVAKNIKEQWIEVRGPKKLRSLGEVNMHKMPDTAQTLAVVAAFAKGRTRIVGLHTLRLKETDRLAALSVELKKMGIKTKTGDDYIVIYGGNPHGDAIETYNDHRMAMAFAVAGVRIPGMEIVNPEVVNKSFPEFWTYLNNIGVKTSP